MTAPRPARTVLVPRPAGRGARLLALLAAQGAVAEHHPLIALTEVTGQELDAARTALTAGEYSHLVVTSPSGAEALGAVAVPVATAVVAVGRGTAAALAAVGITAAHVATGSGAALVQEMPEPGPGARVLFPASAAASRTVPDGLRAKGYAVHEVTAYRPVPAELPSEVAAALAGGRFAAIVLTSPMIARRAAALGVHASTAVVVIGEPTAEAARAAGLRVDRQAAEPTDEGLADAVAEVLGPAPPSAAPPSAAPDHSSPHSEETR